MVVLDLDLDLFVTPIKEMATSDGPRLSGTDYSVEQEASVRHFLEDQCGLRQGRPTPAALITHHHEAFFAWRDLIEKQKLDVPFHVIHADAHADLGGWLGSNAGDYIGCDLMHRALQDRTDPEIASSKMNDGNYLLIAMANEWIETLTYVSHDDNKWDDVPTWLFAEGETDTVMTLPKYDPSGYKGGFSMLGRKVICRGKPIRLQLDKRSSFSNRQPIDYVMLCMSPSFTPPQADALIPIITEYLEIAQ